LVTEDKINVYSVEVKKGVHNHPNTQMNFNLPEHVFKKSRPFTGRTALRRSRHYEFQVPDGHPQTMNFITRESGGRHFTAMLYLDQDSPHESLLTEFEYENEEDWEEGMPVVMTFIQMACGNVNPSMN